MSRHSGAGRAGALALGVCLLGACAGTAAGPAPLPPPAGPMFLPAAPPASELGTAPVAPAADADPLRAMLAEAAARAAQQEQLPPLARDARLDRVGDDVARGTPEDEPYSLALVSFLLGHHGVVEPTPSLSFVRAENATDAQLIEYFRPQLRPLLRQGAWRRLGVGVRRAPGATTMVVVLAEQHLELRPVARRLPSRGSARIAARLLDGFSAPQLLVTAPDGTVDRLFLLARGGWFEGRLACRQGDGAYQVEVAGSGARGPTVLALFAVHCGSPPPAGVPLAAIERTEPEAPAAAERQLYALVNRDRAAAGLWPLRRDPRLEEVARAHSQEMASTGQVGHVLPRTGSVSDRLARARLRPAMVAENLALAYDARQAQAGLMASPGHRANIMDPRFTLVGIGVVAGTHAPGNPAPQLYVTQVFATGL
jgi:uncharacterized protein YkwD